MTYVLTLCLGITWGMCTQIRYVDFPSKQDCEQARDGISKESIGKGYAICAPGRVRGPDTQAKS